MGCRYSRGVVISKLFPEMKHKQNHAKSTSIVGQITEWLNQPIDIKEIKIIVQYTEVSVFTFGESLFLGGSFFPRACYFQDLLQVLKKLLTLLLGGRYY